MTALLIPFPGRRGKLVLHPSRFIDPALLHMGDVMADAATADALFALPFEPSPQNVVPIRPGVYQPGRV